MKNIHYLISMAMVLLGYQGISQNGFQLITTKAQLAGGYDVSCNNAMDGKIFVAAFGANQLDLELYKEGVLVSSYSNVDLPFGFNNLGAGRYLIKGRNQGFEAFSDTIQLFQPAPILITSNLIRAAGCYPGNDGTVEVNMQGGVGPYQLVWEGLPVIGNRLEGLGQGNYTVQVVDGNQCSFSTEINIPLALAPQVNPVVVPLNSHGFHLNCANDKNAWIHLNILNPTGSERVFWEVDQVERSFQENSIFGLDSIESVQTNYFAGVDSLTNLGPGTYRYKVYNDAGCQTTGNLVLLAPWPFYERRNLECNPNYTPSCNCAPLNFQYLNAIGGIEPYSLVGISGGLYDVHGLEMGQTYQFKMQDAYGCSGQGEVHLAVNDGLISELCPIVQMQLSELRIGGVRTSLYAGYHISKENANDGEINFSAIGGSGNYEYKARKIQDQTELVQNHGNFSGLSNGKYFLSVEDLQTGQRDTTSIELKQPGELAVTINPQFYQSCETPQGFLTAYVTGGTPGYKLEWHYQGNAGETTDLYGDIVKMEGLGSYHLVVVDANGDRVEQDYSLTQWAPLSVTANAITLSNEYHTRCDQQDGKISVEMSGGFPPFIVQMKNLKVESGDFEFQPVVTNEHQAIIENLGRGYYELTIIDSMGCKQVVYTEIKSPESANFAVTVDTYPNGYHFSCETCGDANATATSLNGTSNQYSWYQDVNHVMSQLPQLEGASSRQVVALPASFDFSQLTSLGDGNSMQLNTPDMNYLVVARNEFGCLSAVGIQLEKPRTRDGWGFNGNQLLGQDAFLGTTDSLPLVLKSNQLEGLRITTQGKVEVPVSLKSAKIFSPEIGTQEFADFQIKTNGENAILVKANGNVGIGTQMPQAKLEVMGNSVFNGNTNFLGSLVAPNLPVSSGNSVSDLSLLSINSQGQISKQPWTSNQDGCATVTTTGTTISAQYSVIPQWEDEINKIYTLCGNVGIGLDNPNSKLHVAGNGLFDGDLTTYDIHGRRAYLQSCFIQENMAQNVPFLTLESNNSALRFIPNLSGGGYNNVSHANDFGIIWSSGNANTQGKGLVIAPASTSAIGLRIDASGKVSINSTTQVPYGFSLGVGGAIICEELDVRLQGAWGDYVFDKNYKRLGLEELKKYLNENKHLPGYPSAQEVEDKGHFSLGQNIQNLTVKTEELFLYLLDLNERLLEVEKENKSLKNQLLQTIKN
ncbi:MAG: SprB repeat-containing protein [Bacteroidia bacterium]|nr:SprB repeat-containing protein [Bacteroidia bacterium]